MIDLTKPIQTAAYKIQVKTVEGPYYLVRFDHGGCAHYRPADFENQFENVPDNPLPEISIPRAGVRNLTIEPSYSSKGWLFWVRQGAGCDMTQTVLDYPQLGTFYEQIGRILDWAKPNKAPTRKPREWWMHSLLDQCMSACAFREKERALEWAYAKHTTLIRLIEWPSDAPLPELP